MEFEFTGKFLFIPKLRQENLGKYSFQCSSLRLAGWALSKNVPVGRNNFNLSATIRSAVLYEWKLSKWTASVPSHRNTVDPGLLLCTGSDLARKIEPIDVYCIGI